MDKTSLSEHKHVVNFNESIVDFKSPKKICQDLEVLANPDKFDENAEKPDLFPYKCTKCASSFSTISEAQVHFETEHDEMNEYSSTLQQNIELTKEIETKQVVRDFKHEDLVKLKEPLDQNDRIVEGEDMKTKNMLKTHQSATKQTEFSLTQTIQNLEASETNALQAQIDFEGHHASSLATNDLKTRFDSDYSTKDQTLEQNDLEANPMNDILILKPQNDELSKIRGPDTSEVPNLEAVEYKVPIQEENELLGNPIEYECNETNTFIEYLNDTTQVEMNMENVETNGHEIIQLSNIGGPDSNRAPNFEPNPMNQWKASKTNVSQAQIDFESFCENITAEEQMSKENSTERTVFDTQTQLKADIILASSENIKEVQFNPLKPPCANLESYAKEKEISETPMESEDKLENYFSRGFDSKNESIENQPTVSLYRHTVSDICVLVDPLTKKMVPKQSSVATDYMLKNHPKGQLLSECIFALLNF